MTLNGVGLDGQVRIDAVARIDAINDNPANGFRVQFKNANQMITTVNFTQTVEAPMPGAGGATAGTIPLAA